MRTAKINSIELLICQKPKGLTHFLLESNGLLHLYFEEIIYEPSGFPCQSVSDDYIELPVLPPTQKYSIMPDGDEAWVKMVYPEAMIGIFYEDTFVVSRFCRAISESYSYTHLCWQSAKQNILDQLKVGENEVMIKIEQI